MAQEITENGVAHKPKRGRSPNFPGINLEGALERVEQLYLKERRHSAPLETIMEHWGYAAKSGLGSVTLGALKQFGLLEQAFGSGEARLTELALKIVQDDRPSSLERQEAIKEAALAPKLHRDIWAHYSGDLPSDSNIRFVLLREKDFTEGGADAFIKQFRSTIAYAQLGASDNITEEEQDKPPDEPPLADGIKLKTDTLDMPNPAPPDSLPSDAIQTLRAPLGRGRAVVVQMPAEMSVREWETMMTNLAAWKLGTVVEPDEPSG